MDIKEILDGHTKNLLGLNKDISLPRLNICKKCPLYKETVIGAICNSKVWVNPNNYLEISLKKKDGYVNGCGCILKAKTTLPNAQCPLNKW